MKLRNITIRSMVVIGLIILVCQSIRATIIIPITLESLTEASDAIVVGTVKSQRSYWEENNIYTDVVIEIQEFVKKGKEPETTEMTLKIIGGIVGDITQEVDGGAEFQTGDRAMIFLQKVKGHYTPFALSYGVYKIMYDTDQQQEFVNGAFFDYPEHMDLKTKKFIRASEDIRSKASKELRSFIKRIKGYNK